MSSLRDGKADQTDYVTNSTDPTADLNPMTSKVYKFFITSHSVDLHCQSSHRRSLDGDSQRHSKSCWWSQTLLLSKLKLKDCWASSALRVQIQSQSSKLSLSVNSVQISVRQTKPFPKYAASSPNDKFFLGNSVRVPASSEKILLPK